MRKIIMTAAVLCWAMPVAFAQQDPRAQTLTQAPVGSPEAYLEQQLAPTTPPLGTLRVVEQSSVTTLGNCRNMIIQRLQSAQVKYDNDNFSANPVAIDAPLRAYVYIGEGLYNFACEWAQQPCLTTQQPVGPYAQFPSCDINQIIMKVYKES